MKTKLHYQISNYECGRTCLMNALSYSLEREEIPPELIKIIWEYTLDCNKNNIAELGTSSTSLKHVSEYINRYQNLNKEFKIKTIYFEKEDVSLETFKRYSSSVILYRCNQSGDHYVIITKIENNNIYIWDPYYLTDEEIDKNTKNIKNKPYEYNRIITIEQLHNNDKTDFSLVDINHRDALIFIK